MKIQAVLLCSDGVGVSAGVCKDISPRPTIAGLKSTVQCNTDGGLMLNTAKDRLEQRWPRGQLITSVHFQAAHPEV